MVLLHVPDRGFGAGAGPMGGYGANAHGGLPRHLAANLRERPDVCDAAFRRPHGAQALASRVALGVLSARVERVAAAQRGELTGHGVDGGDGVGYLCPTFWASGAEGFRRGGALLTGLRGPAGTLSIYFVLPKRGRIFD